MLTPVCMLFFARFLGLHFLDFVTPGFFCCFLFKCENHVNEMRGGVVL
jgi:hypothetical protein